VAIVVTTAPPSLLFAHTFMRATPATGEFMGHHHHAELLPRKTTSTSSRAMNLDWLQYLAKDGELRARLVKYCYLRRGVAEEVERAERRREKVRRMLSKMMLKGQRALVLDDPTNHPDLESIQALNNGLKDYPARCCLPRTTRVHRHGGYAHHRAHARPASSTGA
jgi:hypothetical protein